MKDSDWLVIGAIGVGAYFLLQNKEAVSQTLGGVGSAVGGLGEGIYDIGTGVGQESKRLLRQVTRTTEIVPEAAETAYREIVDRTLRKGGQVVENLGGGVATVSGDVAAIATTGTGTLRRVTSDASKVITTASSVSSKALVNAINQAPTLPARSGIKVNVSEGTIGLRVPVSGGYSQISYDVKGAVKEATQKASNIVQAVKSTASGVIAAAKNVVSSVATKAKSLKKK